MSGEFDFMNASQDSGTNKSDKQSNFNSNAFGSGPAFNKQEASFNGFSGAALPGVPLDDLTEEEHAHVEQIQQQQEERKRALYEKQSDEANKKEEKRRIAAEKMQEWHAQK